MKCNATVKKKSNLFSPSHPREEWNMRKEPLRIWVALLKLLFCLWVLWRKYYVPWHDSVVYLSECLEELSFFRGREVLMKKVQGVFFSPLILTYVGCVDGIRQNLLHLENNNNFCKINVCSIWYEINTILLKLNWWSIFCIPIRFLFLVFLNCWISQKWWATLLAVYFTFYVFFYTNLMNSIMNQQKLYTACMQLLRTIRNT